MKSASRLLISASLPPLLALVLMLSDGFGLFPALALAQLPDAAPCFALIITPLLIALSLDREEPDPAWVQAITALTITLSGLASSLLLHALYPYTLESSALLLAGASACTASLLMCMACAHPRVPAGICTALITLCIALPPALHVISEFAAQPRLLGASFSPPLRWWLDDGVAWHMLMLGGALYAIRLLFRLQLFSRFGSRKPRQSALGLALLGALLSPSLLQAKPVNARFELAPYLRLNEHNPLTLELTGAPSRVELSINKGPSYELIDPPEKLTLPVFINEGEAALELRAEYPGADAVTQQIDLPQRIAARDQSTRLVGVLASRSSLQREQAWQYPSNLRGTDPLAAPLPVVLGDSPFTDWRLYCALDAVLIVAPEQLNWSYQMESALTKYLASGGLVVLVGSTPVVVGDAEWILPMHINERSTFVTIAPHKHARFERVGAGRLLVLPSDVMTAEQPAELIFSALEIGFSSGGDVRPWGATLHAQARGALAPSTRASDFAKHGAHHSAPRAIMLAAIMLAAAALCWIATLALRTQRAKLILAACGAGGTCVVVMLLVSTTDVETPRMEAHCLLQGSRYDSRALATSLLAIDPNQTPQRLQIAPEALLTPYSQSSQSLRYVYEAEAWSVTPPTAAVLRVDRPILRGEAERVLSFALRENRVSVEHSEISGIAAGERMRSDQLEARLMQANQRELGSALAGWCETYVRGARAWRLEVTDEELPAALWAYGEDQPASTRQRTLSAFPKWRGAVFTGDELTR